MKKLLTRWFGENREEALPSARRTAVQVPPLVLRPHMTFPIVDWDAMDVHKPATADQAFIDEFWSAAAKAWLETLRVACGDSFAIHESERFLLLSPLSQRPAQVVLEYPEKTRKRIGRLLDGIARESEQGKVCALIFKDQDQYYKYVSNYYLDEGEFSLSGGMFLQHGYGHFVFVQDDMSNIEPAIAHELTHCLLQHLPLPAWLNEGIAVNIEHRLSPPPGRPLYMPDEMQQRHIAYWNETTIQEFWSGKSWRHPGESNSLSYDLAKQFVGLGSRDPTAFREFANAADVVDSADAAARAYLGYPVAHLAHAVLGEGPWRPDPAKWNEGMERGQF